MRFYRIWLLSTVLIPACIEPGRLRTEPSDDVNEEVGGMAGAAARSSGGLGAGGERSGSDGGGKPRTEDGGAHSDGGLGGPPDEGSGGTLPASNGGAPNGGTPSTSGGAPSGGGASGGAPSGGGDSGGVSSGGGDSGGVSSGGGNSGGAPSGGGDSGGAPSGGGDSGGGGRASSEHYVVYSFKNGAWATYDFESPSTANPYVYSVPEDSLGQAGDIPFIWEPHTDSPQVHAGTYRNSDGYFSLDRDGDLTWGASDTRIRFMPPEPNDKPFVITANYYTGTGGASCSKLSGHEHSGPMVGIQRGGLVYLDRTGDGVFTPGGCDLSGLIAAVVDIPSGVPGQGDPDFLGEHILALTRTAGDIAVWYYDNNADLAWSEPPDWTSPTNAFGNASQYFPPSHPDCITTSSGTTVFHDTNCDRLWSDVLDRRYPSAMPNSTWTLAGVDRRK